MHTGSGADETCGLIYARRCLLHVMNRATKTNIESLKAYLHRTTVSLDKTSGGLSFADNCTDNDANNDESREKARREFVTSALVQIFPKLTSPWEGCYRGLYVQFLHVLEEFLLVGGDAKAASQQQWFRKLLMSMSRTELFAQVKDHSNKPLDNDSDDSVCRPRRRAVAELVAWLSIEGFLSDSAVLAEIVRPLLSRDSNSEEGKAVMSITTEAVLDVILALFEVLAQCEEAHAEKDGESCSRSGALLHVVAEALEDIKKSMQNVSVDERTKETMQEKRGTAWSYRAGVLVELSVRRWEKLCQRHHCHCKLKKG